MTQSLPMKSIKFFSLLPFKQCRSVFWSLNRFAWKYEESVEEVGDDSWQWYEGVITFR